MAGDVHHGPSAAQFGDDNTQINTFVQAPRRPASWPHQVGVIPSRAECFQDRAEAARLRQVLAGGGTAVVGQAQRDLLGGVLAGLGGVGKTQLAADYARTAWSAGEVDVLVWLTAGTRSAAVDVYARAAVELLGVDADDPERAAATFLAWLEPKAGARPCRWLVVLDDVADPSVLTGLWPPASPLGRTLVTTRRRDAALTGRGRRRVDVGEFTSEEAADHLTTALAAHGRSEPAADVAALAADLGCLPLALSQAAAYLVDAGVSCAAYRALLADRTRTLTDLSPDVLPDGQAHTMAAAWSLSVDHADGLRPVGLARPMLQLAAFLDPHGIPAGVLAGPPALAHLAAARRGDAPAPSPEDADGALRALHRLSLVQAPDAGGRTGLVRVHQIVQRATRDTLTPEEYDDTARAAADALVSVWPGVERDTAHAQALRACTSALTACAEAVLYHPDLHYVLFRAGVSLGESGQVAAAVGHFQRLSAVTRHRLGPDHPHSFAVLSSLAGWRGEAGDPVAALSAYADLLEDHLRVLGPDHPDTLAIRNNSAYWQGEVGDPAGALDAYADLLVDRVRVLGADHPDTLATRSNLARWQGEAGDPARAAAALADLLPDMVRVLGPDHPRTLTACHNLAYWWGEAGDPAGALGAYADVLADTVRVFGPDHPETLAARINLAHWQGEAGDPAGALGAYADLLADMVRVLGPDHPNTLAARINRAHWQGEAGDPAGAAAVYADLLADMVRVLGPDHPHTLTVRNNLVGSRRDAGDPADTAAAYADLLADMVRVLGPDHPDTLATRTDLAQWQGAAGDPAGAAAAYADLLEDRLRLLGSDHRDIRVTRGLAAHWQGRAGDPQGAAAAFADLLDDHVKRLGADHPATLTVGRHLAHWQAQNGGSPDTPD